MNDIAVMGGVRGYSPLVKARLFKGGQRQVMVDAAAEKTSCKGV
jgi:hypothetical protein